LKRKGSVVTIGVFDGVHLGHKIIIKKMLEEAKRYGLTSHVLSIIYPFDYYEESFSGLIITPNERIEKLEELGVDYVTFLDLIEIKDMQPEEFVTKVLLEHAQAVKVIIGHDFKFGKNRNGNVDFLKFLGNKYGFSVHEIPPIFHKGVRISSTIIRRLISSGKVDEACELLGEPYSISGVIVEGKKFGRKLGFPTINIKRPAEKLVMPKNGVYVARVKIGEHYFPGVMNIGLNPTVSNDNRLKYEVHLLDFEGNLYNKKVIVQILKFLRSEEKFESLDELKRKISEDVEGAREYFLSMDKNMLKEVQDFEVQIDSNRFRWYIAKR